MTLMAKPPRKKTPEINRDAFPSAWQVLTQIAKVVMGLQNPALHAAKMIQLEIPEDGLPVRDIIRECPYRITYGVPSIKTNRTIGCESYNESCMAHTLEAHPEIASFVEQPFTATWLDRFGNVRKHTPDFLAKFKSGTSIVLEVKEDTALLNPEIIERTEHFSKYLPHSHSMIYIMFTNSQLQGQELANACIIDKYEKMECTELEFDEIKQMFHISGNRLSLHFFEGLNSRIPSLNFKIKSLIRTGFIGFDMKRTLNTQTLLFWRQI